jgi:hypothetical protein
MATCEQDDIRRTRQQAIVNRNFTVMLIVILLSARSKGFCKIAG